MSGFNTSLLHDGVDDYTNGATLVPIYQSSAFKHESAEELERIFDNKAMGFSYTRINNPTIEAFEKRITKLEKGFSSVACSSGMAAIFNSIANIVRQGDEVVASCGLYGGTVELFEDLESFGITVKHVPDNKPECFEELITDETRVVFAETIGNPKLDVTDIKAVADVAHAHGIPLIVDNTVSTPTDNDNKFGPTEANTETNTEPNTKPSTQEEDVLILSGDTSLSGKTINNDVYITYSGVVEFDNITINGDIYCYGVLRCSSTIARNVYAYSGYNGMFSCSKSDGVRGVSGDITCNELYIQDDALDYAFSKWGKY